MFCWCHRRYTCDPNMRQVPTTAPSSTVAPFATQAPVSTPSPIEAPPTCAEGTAEGTVEPTPANQDAGVDVVAANGVAGEKCPGPGDDSVTCVFVVGSWRRVPVFFSCASVWCARFNDDWSWLTLRCLVSGWDLREQLLWFAVASSSRAACRT